MLYRYKIKVKIFPDHYLAFHKVLAYSSLPMYGKGDKLVDLKCVVISRSSPSSLTPTSYISNYSCFPNANYLTVYVLKKLNPYIN